MMEMDRLTKENFIFLLMLNRSIFITYSPCFKQSSSC